MAEETGPPPSATLDDLRRIDLACLDYERAWRDGRTPTIESALEGWPDRLVRPLLDELIPLDVELRAARGLPVDPADYRARFPGAEGAIVDAFRTPGDGPPGDPGRTVAWQSLGDPWADGGPPTVRGGPLLFGDYELLGEIERGGMGIVFRARHRRKNRIEAVKMILAGRFAAEADLHRFRLEAELASNLEHPNIVPIYEVGECEGRLYFSMKLIDGGNLSSRVPELIDDPRAVAKLLLAVAGAVAHAHSRGFVHCDLKPANILLDSQGKPYVTDFGLSRRFGDESGLTVTGAVVGTASYMAPEQASGNRRALTPAADVYGLGAILYELLTGRPPFRAASVMETVVQVIEREPPTPRSLRPAASVELERICLRCLEKSPQDRYASAEDLALALEQYLRGEAVAGANPWHRLRRWTRRQPELVARLVGLSAVFLLDEYNFRVQGATYETSYYWRIQGGLAVWAFASVVYQAMLSRGRWPELTRYAWAATDVLSLTAILDVMGAGQTSRVLGYPLLIAASGLWCRTPLVWFTTLVSAACYAYLRVTEAPGVDGTIAANVDVAAILLTGFVVARQVKRIWAMSSYHENRAGD